MSRIIVSRAKYQDGLITGATLSTETIVASSVSQAVETAAAADDEAWSIAVPEKGARIWAAFGANPVAVAGTGHLLVGPGTYEFAAATGQKVAFIVEVAHPLERYAEPKNLTTPTVTGTARVGETLSATGGTWEGNPAPALAYQWLADGEPIEGATGSTLDLTADLLGAKISVQVTATNDYGSVTAVSAETDPVEEGLAAPANTVLPSISGTAQVGETLTADDGEWTGNPAPTISRVWKANDVEISGATGTTYTLTEAELDAQITVTVTATNSEGSAEATSAAVGPVIAAG